MSQERVMTRRELLELIIAGGAGLAASAVHVGPTVFRLTPGPELPYFSNYPQPGWLETRNQLISPAFLDTKEGHKEYLRNIVLNDPLFNDPDKKSGIMQKAYNDLFFTKPSPDNPSLGDAFQKHVTYATERLKDLFPIDQYGEPTVENVLHVAITSFAALYSPYFNQNEIRNSFGIPLDNQDDDTSIWWLSHAYENVPSVFPVDATHCTSEGDRIYRCEGVDRAVHFAQHLFITHNFIYGHYHSLPFIKRIPLGVSFALIFGKNLKEKARILSYRAGEVWEAMETWNSIQGNNTLDENGNAVPTGLFDLYTLNDFAANSFGTQMAIDLSDGVQDPTFWSAGKMNTLQKTWLDISTAIFKMNQRTVNEVPQIEENIFSLYGLLFQRNVKVSY